MERENIEKSYGFVYLTTNLKNGMKYIGQKKIDKNRRWQPYLGKGKRLIQAVKEYGKENFKREILALAYSREELNELEDYFIKKNDAGNNPEFYNMINTGYVFDKTQDTINKLRKSGVERGKKITCLTTKEEFNSIKEACRTYKIDRRRLQRVLSGKAKSKICGYLPDGTKLKWKYDN